MTHPQPQGFLAVPPTGKGPGVFEEFARARPQFTARSGHDEYARHITSAQWHRGSVSPRQPADVGNA